MPKKIPSETRKQISTFTLSPEAIQKIENEKKRTGKSKSKIVNQLILGAL